MLVHLSKKESQIRIIAGVATVTLGTHFFWYLFLPMGYILIRSGMLSKCGLTQFIRPETQAGRDYFFGHSLPKNNPQPVFIFKSDKQITFRNPPAKALFPDLNTFSNLSDLDIKKIISQQLMERRTLKLNNGKVYSLLFRGSLELDAVMVYGSDISEVINLNKELLNTQKEIVYAMGEIAETRSKETGDHVRRVAEYSELLALLSGINKTEAELIKFASPMHDIGKVGIPDSILNKPGKLTTDEFTIMKTHAELGFNLLNHSDRPVLKTAAIISYQHHEKWDGNGYPQQLAGENIHIYGRITAVADVFDALGSARVYKEAWPLEKILSLFAEQRGIHFDPKLVDLLLNNLPQFLAIRDKYTN
jgi:response regulator RpfG family c-di-GMP phosphodiesterase